MSKLTCFFFFCPFMHNSKVWSHFNAMIFIIPSYVATVVHRPTHWLFVAQFLTVWLSSCITVAHSANHFVNLCDLESHSSLSQWNRSYQHLWLLKYMFNSNLKCSSSIMAAVFTTSHMEIIDRKQEFQKGSRSGEYGQCKCLFLHHCQFLMYTLFFLSSLLLLLLLL